MVQKRDVSQFQPVIERLKAIAAESGDRLLLADGPPNPDAQLLDLCADALHHLKEAEKAHSGRPRYTGDWSAEDRRRSEAVSAIYWEHIGLAKRPMLRAKRIRATTPAGIYAKALCVRCSRTGAAEFAMSLAEDLVNNHALRALLWGAEAEPSPVAAQADNVVTLMPRSRGEGAP